MKGEIIYKILNLLADQALEQIDFMNVVLRAGYGASSGKIKYELSQIQNKRTAQRIDKHNLNKFQKYLSKLKSKGLILENNTRQLYLSEKGKKKLARFQSSFSLNKSLYGKKSGDKFLVISYDIPIAFNRERNILRDMLQTLGFYLVHKSVWVGKIKLPERFVSDLSKLGIMDYVEILEVTKTGTIKPKN